MNEMTEQICQVVTSRAIKLLMDGACNEAEAAFQYVLSIKPTHAEAHFRLAEIHHGQGFPENAMAHIRKAVEGAPGNKRYLNYLTQLQKTGSLASQQTPISRNSVFRSNAEVSPNFQVGIEGQPSQKRLLITVDYASQPYSLGDLLLFQYMAALLAESLEPKAIDFCFISDPDGFTADETFRRLISRENRYLNIFSFLPVVQLTPRLGSLFVFDSHLKYFEFIELHESNYALWPSLDQINKLEYMYYNIFQAISDFHMTTGRLPQLHFNDELFNWTSSLFERHVYPSLPVTVNIRNNPEIHDYRNSNIFAWKEFFNHCLGRYPVKFIVICGQSEIDEGLSSLPNVVFAKTLGSNVVQDLAIVQYGAFHIGSSSGPNILNLFKGAPFYAANNHLLPYLQLYNGILRHEMDAGCVRFTFSSPLQRLGVLPESSDLLITEFERIWNSADWSEFRASKGGRFTAGP